jgi:hypothetical protein
VLPRGFKLLGTALPPLTRRRHRLSSHEHRRCRRLACEGALSQRREQLRTREGSGTALPQAAKPAGFPTPIPPPPATASAHSSDVRAMARRSWAGRSGSIRRAVRSPSDADHDNAQDGQRSTMEMTCERLSSLVFSSADHLRTVGSTGGAKGRKAHLATRPRNPTKIMIGGSKPDSEISAVASGSARATWGGDSARAAHQGRVSSSARVPSRARVWHLGRMSGAVGASRGTRLDRALEIVEHLCRLLGRGLSFAHVCIMPQRRTRLSRSRQRERSRP